MVPKRKRLLVLLGAGSSVGQGMPNVEELNDRVRKWAAAWSDQKKGDGTDRIDYYGRLIENREKYYAAAPGLVKARFKTNYERLLGDLHSFMNGALRPAGDPILQWLGAADAFRDLGIAPPGNDAANRVHFIGARAQLEYLLGQLAYSLRGDSAIFEYERETRSTFESYEKLFSGLTENFDLGVYNLNHDTVALSAVPRFFTGFDSKSRRFAPEEVLSSKNWNFLYHMHGSVHHELETISRMTHTRDFGPKIVWKDDIAGSEFKDTENLRSGTDDKRIMRTTLVAGGWKLDQIQEDPFFTFYSSLPRHVYEADALLIGGYGFGDEHISTALSTMLRCKASRPPIFVIDHADPTIPIAQRSDAWAIALQKTLLLDKQKFRDLANRSQTQWLKLPTHLAPDVIEFHPQSKTAISYGGFEEASVKLSDILSWLREDGTTGKTFKPAP
jgi:hypothetical protein